MDTMKSQIGRSNASRLHFAAFSLLIGLMTAGGLKAVVIITDPVEDDGGWTVTGNTLQFSLRSGTIRAEQPSGTP